ncbi:hypothetical protein BGZ73_003334 [Actinomortierella ambigua]|nr:hypothetical protein BGZ73_003334 [Actinomortierella ambigua]
MGALNDGHPQAQITKSERTSDLQAEASQQRSSLLPALPLDDHLSSRTLRKPSSPASDSDTNDLSAAVESLGIHSPPSVGHPSHSVKRTQSSEEIHVPKATSDTHPAPSSTSDSAVGEHIETNPPGGVPTFTSAPTSSISSSASSSFASSVHPLDDGKPPLDPRTPLKSATAPAPIRTHSLEPPVRAGTMGISPHGGRQFASAGPMNDSPMSTLNVQQQHQQQWLHANASPRLGPFLSPSHASPSLSPYQTSPSVGPFTASPGTLGNRKGSVSSMCGGISPRTVGFRGAPLGQTSDVESVLKQFDVHKQKTYLTGQLRKKDDFDVQGKQMHVQWFLYDAKLIGPRLYLTPSDSNPDAHPSEIHLEEAIVEMQDSANGGSFTINWQGANRSTFESVQKLNLMGESNVGQSCQDWVCAIRLSMYELSRLQEIYTSTLLRQPKFREQVSSSVEGAVKAEGYLRGKFWAGGDWMTLWVVVTDKRGGEIIKKKRQGKVLQATPIRGQIHFYESPKAKMPFVSMYNVSQAYAVCPSRADAKAAKDDKSDDEGSLIIKLEGDVVLQREFLSPPKKNFFSSPPTMSPMAKRLQALLPTGKSCFAMFHAANAAERNKFLLGAWEAFRIYGKPGPLLFDSPNDPAAMNFAASLIQQELLLKLDDVIQTPQRGESLADVKYMFSEVLRKRLVAEHLPPPISPSLMPRRGSHHTLYRQSTIPQGPSWPEEALMNGAPPSPMMIMAMRSRANSASNFLVPQHSPALHPQQTVPNWSPYGLYPPPSPYTGPMGGSPRSGPMLSANNYALHGRPSPYSRASTDTDENDANLPTDDEGGAEEDDYPDTPEEEDTDSNGPPPTSGHLTPHCRSRQGSLVPGHHLAAGGPMPGMMGNAQNGYYYQQARKGSIGAMSMHLELQGGSRGRSSSFAAMGPTSPAALTAHQAAAAYAAAQAAQQVAQQAAAAAAAAEAAKNIDPLDSFANTFGISKDVGDKDRQAGRKLSAVVYPTQIVIPKNKHGIRRRDSLGPSSCASGEPLSATSSIHSPLPLSASSSMASPTSPAHSSGPLSTHDREMRGKANVIFTEA